MAMTEALRLVIDADARGAVKAIGQVGKAADKELGKTDDRIQRVGNTMQKVGVGMVASGALLVGGLAAAAKASEEAAKSTRKLENSVSNNATLAGHSAKEFTDLAEAIQKKTAADADDIIAGQAVLAQGKLNADQIKTLTPLVVDLARKKGIDEVTAFTLASKAAGGNAGALKKQGIQVDETLAKTDAYKATVDALRGSVGGYAEQEGKTFSGQLERLKNQLGDIQEGVGVGAVDAFSTLLGPVQKLSDGFAEMDPKVQSTIGKVATFGATGLIAAGGVATLVGKAVTLSGTLADTRLALTKTTGGLSGLGRGMAALPLVGAAVGLAAVGHSMAGLHVETDGLATALAQADAAGNKQLQTGYKIIQAAGGLESTTKSLAQTNIEGAKRFVAYAESQGLSAEEAKKLNGIIESQGKANAQATADQEANTAAVEEGASALDGGLTPALADAVSTTKTLGEQTRDLNDALRAQVDPLFGAQDAALRLKDAQDAVAAATKEHGAKSAETAAANREAVRAAAEYESSLLTLDTAVKDGTVDLEDAKETVKRWSEAGYISKDAATQASKAFDTYAWSAGAVPDAVSTTVTTPGLKEAQDALDRLIWTLHSQGMFAALAREAPGRSTGGAVKRANGGPIYASKGMFAPKGSDTVPAMLTPGEFVMRKSAVDKLGVGAMSAINQGQMPGGVTINVGGNLTHAVLGDALHELRKVRLESAA